MTPLPTPLQQAQATIDEFFAAVDELVGGIKDGPRVTEINRVKALRPCAYRAFVAMLSATLTEVHDGGDDNV